MGISTFYARQARKPSGLWGRFIMSKLFDKGNLKLNTFVWETLCVEEKEHILEIGCGTGLLMQRIADSSHDVLVEGVDFSPPMVAVARKRNMKHMQSGTVRIHQGDFSEQNFAPDSFDKVVTVNTVYFWKKPQEMLAAVHDVLKPGGKLFIGFINKSDLEKLKLNKDVFTLYSVDDMRELLAAGGLMKNVSIMEKQGRRYCCYCAVTEK